MHSSSICTWRVCRTSVDILRMPVSRGSYTTLCSTHIIHHLTNITTPTFIGATTHGRLMTQQPSTPPLPIALVALPTPYWGNALGKTATFRWYADYHVFCSLQCKPVSTPYTHPHRSTHQQVPSNVGTPHPPFSSLAGAMCRSGAARLRSHTFNTTL